MPRCIATPYAAEALFSHPFQRKEKRRVRAGVTHLDDFCE